MYLIDGILLIASWIIGGISALVVVIAVFTVATILVMLVADAICRFFNID
jgi:hypothetical protein